MIKKLSILLLLSFSLCIGCVVNPITGQEELMLVGESQDLEIGQKYAPEIEKEMGGRIANETLQNYINDVGQKLARVSHRSDLEYHFVALNDKAVNAFALPGGYIFITKGMLEKLTSEAQLAGILGHEITHVVARDTSAAMSREIGISILLSAVTSEQTSRSVLTAADLTRQIIGLRYSRKDEREADMGGMEYMVGAGYNPLGMVETMEILSKEEKGRSIDFLSTHPSPENRVEYLRLMIEDEYPNAKGLKKGREDYSRFVLQQLN
jgi:predicted Zn-dependent protease